MAKVQRNENEWSLPMFLSELFNHCFPADFKIAHLKRLNTTRQNGRPFKTWTDEIHDLAEIVGDTSDEQLILHLWEGADTYISVKWVETGYTPENSQLETLIETAKAFEKGSKLRNQILTDNPRTTTVEPQR